MAAACRDYRCLCQWKAPRACGAELQTTVGLLYCTRPEGHSGEHYCCGVRSWPRQKK